VVAGLVVDVGAATVRDCAGVTVADVGRVADWDFAWTGIVAGGIPVLTGTTVCDCVGVTVADDAAVVAGGCFAGSFTFDESRLTGIDRTCRVDVVSFLAGLASLGEIDSGRLGLGPSRFGREYRRLSWRSRSLSSATLVVGTVDEAGADAFPEPETVAVWEAGMVC
jgi:hypothetical protein